MNKHKAPRLTSYEDATLSNKPQTPFNPGDGGRKWTREEKAQILRELSRLKQ